MLVADYEPWKGSSSWRHLRDPVPDKLDQQWCSSQPMELCLLVNVDVASERHTESVPWHEAKCTRHRPCSSADPCFAVASWRFHCCMFCHRMSWTYQRNSPWCWWYWEMESNLSRAKKCEVDSQAEECWVAVTCSQLFNLMTRLMRNTSGSIELFLVDLKPSESIKIPPRTQILLQKIVVNKSFAARRFPWTSIWRFFRDHFSSSYFSVRCATDERRFPEFMFSC